MGNRIFTVDLNHNSRYSPGNYENLSIQVGQPFRRERFKSTFEDKRLKEGGCHETIYQIWYNRGTGGYG